MTPKEQAAMQQALEALLRSIPDEALLMYVPEEADEFHRKAITALREALAQPQEQSHCKRCNGTGVIPDGVIDFVDGMQLETEIECVRDCPDCTKAQPQGEWVDLTDDEIKTAYESWWETHDNHAFPIWVGAKAAIAKFKSKNTPPVVPQGEPVAWMFCLDGCNQVVLDEDSDSVIRHNGTPLVPAPQPVKELTDDEIGVVIEQVRRVNPLHSKWDFARAVIAADREKNK